MNSLAQNDKTLRKSKKIALQNRMLGKKRRAALIQLLKKDVVFLELETSLSIWAEIERKHISGTTPYNGYVQIEVQDDFETYIQKMESVLLEFGELSGFCFTSNWKSTGVAILDSADLSDDLNSILLSNNDEVSFFNAELNKAILFFGDRSGSADKLNELSVSVLGADWVRKWEKGSK